MTRGARPAAWSFGLLLLVTGCGARTALDDLDSGVCVIEGAPGLLVCEETTTSPSPTCTMRGGDDARQSVTCDGERCRWYTDGVLRCECTELDPTNRCSNGVPTCASWYGYIDFSELHRCP